MAFTRGVVVCSAILLAGLGGPPPLAAQSPPAAPGRPQTPGRTVALGHNVGPRAAAGDTVLVVGNPVRADRRQDFDRFVEAFWSAGRRADPRGFAHVRVLRPTQASPDGSYTYFFVFDPTLPGGDTGLEPALRRLFPRAEADRLLKQFEGALAGPQTAWVVVQSRF